MSGPIARLEHLTYWYPNAASPALRDVTLEIEPGLTLVAGGSGGGKSTLLRVFDGLVPQFHGGRISGSAIVAGLDAFRTPIPRLARHAGLVFQDVETQSVYGTVEREIAFGLENAGMARPEMHDRVDEALHLLGIEKLRVRRLATLSGGERQRVQLAAVLALRPQLVALDEPTSQLDREGADAVLAACLSLATRGRSVLLAEHRLEQVLPAADRLLLMENGSALGPGPVRELAARLASPPPLLELAIRAGWMPLPLTVEEAANSVSRDLNLSHPAARSVPRGTGDEPAWEARDLTVGPAADPVLEGFSFAAAQGEVVAIVGANGSGKTTLLRTLAGLLPPLSGTVQRHGGRAGYVPQNPASMLHLPTLRAEVELTVRRLGVTTAAEAGTDTADGVLADFGLADLAGRYPRDLSSGERQRGAIAATLAGRPDFALLDEPTRGMDLAARRSLGAYIRRFSARPSSVVIATHDIDLAAEVADRVVLLKDGRAVDLGPPEVAFAAGSEWVTQIGRLFPGGPVTVGGALSALDRDIARGRR